MLAIDIETIPTEAAMALPYPEADRQPPGSMSKPETIAAWREKDRAAWEVDRVKAYSLNPRLGRVAAIGYAESSDPAEAGSDIVRSELAEAEVLGGMWEYLGSVGTIATFNGLGFDLPFLVTRSIILGVTPVNVADYLRRYQVARHLDCRMVLTNWDQFAKGTMDDWLAALGLPAKTGNGGDVYALVQAGDWDKVRDYAASDAHLTYLMAERLAPWWGVA
jgi:hypothetical protein